MHSAPESITFAPGRDGRARVQRDMELIRKILLAVQTKATLKHELVKIDGVDDEIVGRHVEMLFNAGYLEGRPMALASQSYVRIGVKDLSWQGHDFLSALENQGVWSKLKESFGAGELATLPLTVIKDAAVGLLRQYALQKLGLSDS